jgi:predicted secreted protein
LSVSLPANQIIVPSNSLAAATTRRVPQRSINRANVFRFRLSGLAILTDIVAYLRAISQRPAPQHRRDMDEHILPAIAGRDEAKAVVLIEEFNGAGRHDDPRELSGVRAASGS